MKAAVLTNPGHIEYQEWKTPAVEDGMVKIKIAVCGICGSDIPRVLQNAAHFYPVVLGHEFAGIVEETGNGVKSVKAGDHVAGVPLLPCGKCESCQRGNYSLCEGYDFVGSRSQGGFAEYVVLPEKNVVRISEQIPFIQAATIEPSTVALHALKLSGFEGGKTVAVLGCGIIGMYIIQWTKLMGAAKVVAIGRGKEGCIRAEKCGAEAGISVLEADWMQKAKQLNDGKGYDYVFEAAGAVQSIKASYELVGKRGQVCLIGTPKENIGFTVKEWELLNRKEFSLTASWMSYSAPFPGEEWELTAKAMQSGKLKFQQEMIRDVIPMWKADQAFQMFTQPGKVQGRILLANKWYLEEQK